MASLLQTDVPTAETQKMRIYLVVFFNDLVDNPGEEVARIYRQFGLDLSEDFQEILKEETINSRQYTSANNYSLEHMDLQVDSIKKEFSSALEGYKNERFPKKQVVKRKQE